MAGGVIDATERRNASLQWLDRLLDILRAWQLAAACSALLLILLSTSLLFPQLPGQVSEDPVATARWLQEWLPAAGPLGGLWRGLGLYAVLTSPLFQATAALLLILAAVHLADSIALLLALRRLPTALHAPVGASPEPVPVVYPRQVFRHLTVTPTPPHVLGRQIEAELAATQPGQLWQATIEAREQPTLPAVTTDSAESTVHENIPGDSSTEQRWLLVHHASSAWLRPLLFGGLALALLSIWMAVHIGWSVAPAALAPGESYGYPPHDILLEYGVRPGIGDARPVLTATIASDVITLNAATDRNGRIGGADVEIGQGPPAMWVETADPLLLAPGGLPDEASSGLGVLFPQPGSEQVVVLANRNAGLRIVRLADGDMGEPAFLVEVYEAGSVQPSQRLQVNSDARVVMGEEDTPLELKLTPTVGVQVEVSRRPGRWLLWLALCMAAVGALGYLRRPGFTLVQLSLWPIERSVVIVQSNRPTPVRALSQPT